MHLWVNSFSSLTLKNWLVYLLFYKRLDQIITPAKYLENELQSFFGINTKVNTIYNFLDIEKIEIYEKEKRIIHIGQLVEQKAQHYLLESFSKVKEQS